MSESNGTFFLILICAAIGAFFIWASAGGYDSFLPGHRLSKNQVKQEREESKNIFLGVFLLIVLICIVALGG